MRPWLTTYAQKVVSDKELVAMAWLIGFWLGNSHCTGAVFSSNSSDVDLNEFLEKQAKLWLTCRYAKQTKPVGSLCVRAYLETYINGVWNSSIENPLTDTLKRLEFYAEGVFEGPKNFPEFVKTEEMIVREALLAGFFDANGTTYMSLSNLDEHYHRQPTVERGQLIYCSFLRIECLDISHTCQEKRKIQKARIMESFNYPRYQYREVLGNN